MRDRHLAFRCASSPMRLRRRLDGLPDKPSRFLIGAAFGAFRGFQTSTFPIRPDAWLCELTLQETATEPASTTAVGGSEPSADSGPIAGVAAPVEATRRLHVRASDPGFLPIQVEHYVKLLDWTGREPRADKRGAIPDDLAPIVERLGLKVSRTCRRILRGTEKKNKHSN